jgi:DNA-binding SARP family transcriptional activator/predicted ATPase
MSAQRLTVHVLGRAELAVDGRPLAELASVKAAALLIHLAVTGTGHPRSALAGLLWSDLPEDAARANLRLVLTKLRRVVPQHLDVTRRGVALAAGAPVWVDAAALTDPALPGPEAVRLCRGEFLHGFDVPGAALFDDWVAQVRASTRADMLAVLDRAARQAAADGDPAAGIDAARRMLELDRLHEAAHRTLMRFLAAGGQRGAALAQYETCRYLLDEELGIPPSPDTTALRDELAAADPPPGARATPPGAGLTSSSARVASPGVDLTSSGVRVASSGAPVAPPGVRVASSGAPVTSPGVRVASSGALVASPGAPAASSGARVTSLVGRAGELARLRELLDDPACRLVTLVGPGGAGKTRLALEVAGARHRAVFVPLAEATDLVTELARACGVPLTAPRRPLDLLAEHLCGPGDVERRLLVLDNLEHVPDAGAALADLLHRVPGLRLLVTSRRPLGLGVEWLVEVAGLPFPPEGAGGGGDADFAGFAAVRLFQERARPLRPGVEADVDGAARICRLVGGLPLAVELAARWVRAATPSAIADRLEHGLELLHTTAPDVPPRHRSMQSVFDASVRLLSGDERRALRRLSVLHGFDLAAAAAVAGAGLPLLAGLVDQSLVTAGPDGRYAMHPLLRQYAARRLAEDPAEAAETRARHAAHFAATLADGEAGPGAPMDAANVRAATDWLVQAAGPADLDAHLVRLWTLYRRTGAFREAQVVLGAALRRDDVPDVCRARWHRLLGEAHQQFGEAGAARRELELAFAVLGGPLPASDAGWAAMLAVQAARRLLPAGPPDPARRERAAVAFALNEVYWVLDEHRRMLPVALRSVNDAERAGDPGLTARNRAGLGMMAGGLGLHRLARRHLAAAVAEVERTGDPLTACWVGIVGGLHWTGVADWAAVDAAADRVLAGPPDVPLHRWADEVRLIAGVAQHLSGRRAAALASAAASVAAGRDRRDPVVHLWGLLLLIEATVGNDAADPSLEGWVAEAYGLLPAAARIDAARLYTAHARMHLAAARPAEAWSAVRTADRLVGPRPAPAQYGLEALAGIAEVCLTLLQSRPPGDPEVRAVEAAAVRRLGRYARTYPMARPRYRIVLGRRLALRGRSRAAARAWTAALREAERLGMPGDAARASALLAVTGRGRRR